MAKVQGDIAEPFVVGQSLTNGNSAIANYSVFMITVQDTKVNNSKCTCIYNKPMLRHHYGICTNTNSGGIDWWIWFTIYLSGNTFTIDGSYTPASLNGPAAGTHYASGEIKIVAIYGIC